VCGDAGRLLLDRVQPAVRGELHQALARDSGAERAREDVLREVQGGRFGVVERDLTHRLLAPQRPPARPAQSVQRGTGEPLRQSGGVLPQDDRPRETRFVLPRALVQHDRRHLLTRERQGEREPHRARADDDHRVHGRPPPACDGSLRDVSECEVGAGCTITERMQPIAGACVK